MDHYDIVGHTGNEDHTIGTASWNTIYYRVGTLSGLKGIERLNPQAADSLDAIYHEATHACFDLPVAPADIDARNARAQLFADKDWQANYQGMAALVESRYRAVFTMRDANV
jgi:hypothetical protein